MIFWAKFAQKVFPVENKKSEHHHYFLHIRISIGTKFQLKLTILIFLTRLTQQGYFQLKTEKVNSTNEFWILELV